MKTVWSQIQQKPFGVLLSGWPWRALGYQLVNILLALVLLPLAVVTAPLIPLYAIALSRIERSRVSWLGWPAIPSGHVPFSRDSGQSWILTRLREPATWRAVIGLTFTIFSGLISAILIFFFMFFSAILISAITSASETGDLIKISPLLISFRATDFIVWISLFLVMILLLLYLSMLLASGSYYLIYLAYSPRYAELETGIQHLTKSRKSLVGHFEDQRKKLERDLHDGVQQDLVTAMVRLGMVSLDLAELAKKGADVARADQSLEEAHQAVERASKSLRNTVRGMHPSVLQDFGITHAYREVAQRSPLDVQISGAELPRFDLETERTAYFFLAEALSNATKYSGATCLYVQTFSDQEQLKISVSDEGIGGVELDKGTGLSGLIERADVLQGTVSISSPVGQGTNLVLTLPVTTTKDPRENSSG